MTVTLENPEAIAEIEQLMARFDLSAQAVLEAVMIEVGMWMPMENFARPLQSLRRIEEFPPQSATD